MSGVLAQFYGQYTVRRNDTGFGYTAAHSNICIASNDPVLTKAIKDKKLYDSRYALYDSVLSPYLHPGSFDYDAALKMDVAIGIQVASLSEFAEHYRKLIWRRVFKGAMYTRFVDGENIAPYFSNDCPYDLSKVYKDSDILQGDGLVSTIATPTTSILKERVELNSIALELSDIVKSFGIFSSAIQIAAADQSPIKVPGSSDVSLISHIISVQGNTARPPVVSVSDAAYSKFKAATFCGEFYGGLYLANSENSKHLVVMNGLTFEFAEDRVTVTDDLRASPNTDFIKQHFTNFQITLTAAEARLNYLLYNERVHDDLSLMQNFFLWLGDSVGQSLSMESTSTLDSDPVAFQARALYLAQLAASPKPVGLPVPMLKYEAYKDTVNSVRDVINTANLNLKNFQQQILQRKAEERAIKRDEQLNENIVKSGNLIVQYISAQASFQEDLNHEFSVAISNTEKEVDLLIASQKDLSAKVNEQQKKVDEKVEKYKEAVEIWESNQTIKSALDIASALFSLGLAFVVPSEAVTAFADLASTVKTIQKLVKIFDAVIQTYRAFKSLPKYPQNVVDALSGTAPGGGVNALQWDEMKVNMDLTLSLGPDISAKDELVAAFAILVLRGKALLEVQDKLQAKLSQLASFYSNKRVHDEQKKRLEALTTKFNVQPQHLDVQSVDLIGMSGQLVFFERQMLAIMASTLVIQDRALQYQYLQPPVSIGAFSFTSLQLAILLQARNITKGLVVQPQPENQPPVIYEVHGVMPEKLTSSQGFSFDIALNNREFTIYNYVRIAKVVAEVDGITSTKSGMYYAELSYDGNPFMDRDFDGKPLTFTTPPRLYTYRHAVDNGAHSKNSKFMPLPETSFEEKNPFGTEISDVTPFSAWNISLPQTSDNEEINFDDSSKGVTVRLIFHVYAQLKENAPPSAENFLSLGLESSTAPVVDVKTVLEKMKNQSVCVGWDAVLSMSEEQVNKNLLAQYNDRHNNPKFFRTTGRVEKVSYGALKTIYDFTFKAPKIQFLSNNSQSAQVTFPIEKCHYQFLVLQEGKWVSKVNYTSAPGHDYSIQGNVPFTHLPGVVSTEMSVALKLSGGKFSTQNFTPASGNPAANDALTKYFTEDLPEGYSVYILGTLDTKNITLIASLTPKEFFLNVFQTPSNRNILQLFIVTTGTKQSRNFLNLDEPYPTMYQCSLIVNSKIFFSNVLPASIGNGGLGLVFSPVAPTDDVKKEKTWSSKTTAGSVSSYYPPKMVDKYWVSGTARPYTPGSWEYDWVKISGNVATVSLTDMTFETDGTNVVMSKKTGELNYTFQYGHGSSATSYSDIYFSDYSVKVNMSLNASLKFSVSGKGQKQDLQLASISSVNETINGDLEPGGSCRCNHHDLQQGYLDNLRTNMGPKLDSILNIKFPSVSLFALENILFPEKNVIDLKEIYVPGDLVIFGNFTSY